MDGHNMRAERARLGLNAKEVSTQIGVHENSLLKWERGESEPLGSNLINLSRLYHCSPDYLLDMTDERNGKEVD